MFNVRLGFREPELLGGPPSHLGAEYRLHVGDVIEIAVAKLPELKQRVRVQIFVDSLEQRTGRQIVVPSWICRPARVAANRSISPTKRSIASPTVRCGSGLQS